MEENKTLSGLKNTKGIVVGHDRIERFQAAFRGEVFRPGDSGYETARKIWNASIDKHPGIIARCAGIADLRGFKRSSRSRVFIEHRKREPAFAQIKFTEWTHDDQRQPVFLGLRTDKEAKDVVRE